MGLFLSCQQHRSINKIIDSFHVHSGVLWKIRLFFYAIKKVFNNKRGSDGGESWMRSEWRGKWKKKSIKMPKVFEFVFLINFIWSKLDVKTFHPCWNSNLCRSSPTILHHPKKFLNLLWKHTEFSFLQRLMFVSKLLLKITSKFPHSMFVAQVNITRTSNVKYE